MIVTALSVLSGCASTHVHNQCPDPHYLSCKSVCELEAKEISDAALNDLIGMTGVMMKLDEVRVEKEKLGCSCK